MHKDFSEQFINAVLAVVLLLNKFKNSLIMNKNILKEIAIMLFELQYEKNGLYGYDISFRMVTDNKSFRVTVFHHGNRDFYMDIKTIDDVNKLNELFSDKKDKIKYRCYGIMTKSDFLNRLMEDKKVEEKKEKDTKVINSNSGFVSNMILLFGGIILLCYLCVEGAIYLVK